MTISQSISSLTGRIIRFGWFRKLLGKDPENTHQLLEVLRSAESRNLIDPDTLTMVEAALQVSENRVRDIMVPRAQMVVIQKATDPGDFLPLLIESGHSRFPVMDEKNNKVEGILLAKDLLAYLANADADEFDLEDIMRPATFVPESKRLNILLRDFKHSRNHLAIVVDEYGGTAGLVSIEDVIEQIVGEIDDEHDIDESDNIRQHRGDRYTVKSRTPIEEFNEYFNTNFEDEEYDTIGGLLLKAFGHLPKRGETLALEGFIFKILRSDKRRIHLLRVVKAATEKSGTNNQS